MYRKTYALINNDLLEENVKNIKKYYNNYKYYFGVVKNNAYNHGIHIIPSLINGGINYLAVSSLDEALEIRKYYIDIPILILEPIDLDDVIVANKNEITIAVDNLDYVKELVKLNLKKEQKVHIIIDCGMNRLGFKEKEDLNDAYKLLSNTDKFFLEGIFTHFPTSGLMDIYYDEAIDKIFHLLEDIDLKKIPIIHFDRSLTLIRHPKIECVNGVRLGILMYGFNSVINYDNSLKDYLRNKRRINLQKKYHLSETYLSNDLTVKPAFSLYSKVISIRKVKEGEIVGYDATYKANKDMLVATISIGYADGVNTKYGEVVINNKRYKIINDCMDMIMVLVDENVNIGDEVEIFGDKISVSEVCHNLNTNAYHLYSMISNRVVRIHIMDQEKSEFKY